MEKYPSGLEEGLRQAFCTYDFALHADENLTAAQAGKSPTMIHAHYKGLATKAEAVKWFKVKPSKSGKNVIPLPAVSHKETHGPVMMVDNGNIYATI